MIINQQQQKPQKFQIPIFWVPILDSGCTIAQWKKDVGKYCDNWYFPGGTSNNHGFRFQFFGYQFCGTLNGHSMKGGWKNMIVEEKKKKKASIGFLACGYCLCAYPSVFD